MEFEIKKNKDYKLDWYKKGYIKYKSLRVDQTVCFLFQWIFVRVDLF